MAEKLLPIKMNVSMAGQGFGYIVGETVDVPEAFARALCELPVENPRADPVGWTLNGEGRSTATRAKREKAVPPESADPNP